MSWRLSGTAFAACSCSVGCPCSMGDMDPVGSVGCSAVQILEIRAGDVDGVDVGGAKVAAAVDWPGALLGGNGTGRLYFDTTTSTEQRVALESVLRGERGGTFKDIPRLVTKMLPAREADISTDRGPDGVAIRVGDFGETKVKPLRSSEGDFVRLLHGAGSFRQDVVLARGSGSRWADPELREWEGGGYAEQSDFDWTHGPEPQDTLIANEEHELERGYRA